MKVVINRKYGGFGLSHEAIMRYAELAGFKLYAFVDARDENGKLDFHKFIQYTGQEDVFLIHYATQPLKSDSTYDNDAYWSASDIKRDDPLLIRVIEEMGETANGRYANLKIVEIPDDVQYEIDEYDGMESIEETHRSWS